MSSEAQRVARAMRESGASEEAELAKRFSAMYDEQFEFVWRTARYLGEPYPSLEDAVQDVFLVAYRRFRDFEARSAPRTWLFSITLRVVSDHRRSRRRKHRLLDGLRNIVPKAVATPFEQTSRGEDGRALLRALDGLSEQQRAAYVMADLEDISVPDIARILDINLNTVYSRLRAARREVAGRLQQQRQVQP